MSQKHSPAQFNNFVQLVLTGYNLQIKHGVLQRLGRVEDGDDFPDRFM